MTTLLEIDSNYLLELSGRRYRLLQVAGYGGSSIVYKAREESIMEPYCVIKELYPHDLGIGRTDTGALLIPEGNVEAFEHRRRRAANEASIVDRLRHDQVHMNNNPWFLPYSRPFEANGTLYTIIATEAGDMLSDIICDAAFSKRDFEYMCGLLLKILDALEPLHNLGYLHLDIAPDNIHYSDLGIMRLIDYNSAYSVSGSTADFQPSYKLGYSAPELLKYAKAKPPALSVATDLYSVTAIFFTMLVGRPPETGDWSNPARWHLTGKDGFLKDASEILIDKMNATLRKGLSKVPGNRFQSVADMRQRVMELMELWSAIELVNSPRRASPHFVGRMEEMGRIHDLLQRDTYVFVEGIGGIGKTELAKKYAEEYKAAYDIIQFVRFEKDLKSTIALALEFAHFDNQKYESMYEKEDLIEYIYREKLKQLKKHNERVLIIVDNYNVLQDDAFYDFVSGDYKVIFTSREKHGANVLEVESMVDETDLLQVFREYYSPVSLKTEDEEPVQGMIRLVLGHTMAIMLVASAMRENEKKPQDMLARLEGSLNTGLPTAFPIDKDDQSANGRGQAMYQHVLTLFRLGEILDNENDNYAFIMANMAIVPETGITKEDFYRWALSDRYESNPYGDQDYSDINWLIARRWIQLDEESRFVSLHPLISQIAFDVCKPDSVRCSGLIKGLLAYAQELNTRTVAANEASANLLRLPSNRITDDAELTVDLYTAYASAHYVTIYPCTALRFLHQSMAMLKRLGGEDQIGIVKTAIHLGRLYHSGDLCQKALEYFNYALELYDLYHTRSEFNPTIIYYCLGDAYYKLSQYAKAYDYYKKSLEMEEMTNGENNKNLIPIQISLARYHFAMDELAKGKEYCRAAFVLSNSIHGERHNNTATLYSLFSEISLSEKDYPKAREHADKAFAIGKELFGENHPRMSPYYRAIGDIYFAKDEFEDAMKYYQISLDICKKAIGETHSSTANAYYSVGRAYYSMSDFENAKDCFIRALRIQKEIYSDHHHIVARSYSSIGRVYQALGDYDKAIECFEEALRIQKDIYGDKSIAVSASFNAIGLAYISTRDFNSALLFLEQALEIALETDGLDSSSLASLYNNNASCLHHIGEYSKALDYYGRALTLHISTVGRAHWRVAPVYNNLGRIHMDLGEPSVALGYFEKAEAIYRGSPRENTIEMATFYRNIGDAYAALADQGQAVSYYNRALSVLSRIFPNNPKHPLILGVTKSIRSLQDKSAE